MGSWWRKPQLRSAEVARKATWLELFFDLVFVAIIAQLSEDLSHHLTNLGMLSFLFLFFPVWLLWMQSTVYNELFDTDDVPHRVMVFLKMLAVVSIAINVHGALDKTGVGFALSFALVRAVILFMYRRARRHAPEAEPFTGNVSLVGSIIVIGLWTASAFVEPPLRFYLWGAVLVVEVGWLLMTVASSREVQSYDWFGSGHLPERLGLFIIIVLGESIIALIHGAPSPMTFASMVKICAGLAIAFCLWWTYFDSASEPGSTVLTAKRAALWSLGSPLLLFGLASIAAGILNAIHHPEVLTPHGRWFLCGSVAVTLLAVAIQESAFPNDPDSPFLVKRIFGRVIGAALCVVIALAGAAWPPAVLICVLVVPCVAQVGMSVYETVSEAYPEAHAE